MGGSVPPFSGARLRDIMAVEKGFAEMGCPKTNIQIRADNVQAAKFYESIGFTGDDIISMGKRLEAD
jgi:ribosomal protein S18 acetylase RimI-like enzyme